MAKWLLAHAICHVSVPPKDLALSGWLRRLVARLA
jgi:hypothetical protein